MILTSSHGDVVNVRLTRHGRQRYLERVNSEANDSEILEDCFAAFFCTLPDPRAHRRFIPVWKTDKRHQGHFRLVTVLVSEV